MSHKIFVTGGAGFIGSNYVRHLMNDTDDAVVLAGFDRPVPNGSRLL